MKKFSWNTEPIPMNTGMEAATAATAATGAAGQPPEDPAGYAPYKSRAHQVEIWLRFRRGTKVLWCPDPESARLNFGVVDCESVTKPGWYYVRDEDMKLHMINWAILSPA